MHRYYNLITMEDPHCFICCETSLPLYKFCRCDVLVHEECLKTTIQTVRTHRSVCHVCKTPYPAVIHVVTKKKIDKYAFATWGLYMASCCFACMAYFVHSSRDFKVYHGTITSMFIFAFCTTGGVCTCILSMFFHCRLWRRARNFCPCFVTRDEVTNVLLDLNHSGSPSVMPSSGLGHPSS